VSYADVRDWRATARTLSQVVVSLEFPINVSEDTLAPQRYNGSYISFDVFRMVGRAPMLGGGFLPDDDRAGAALMALISHTVWQNRYGGDPSIVGRTVRVNDAPATIVGVMPEGFHFPVQSDVWVPVAQRSGGPSTVDANRGIRTVLVVAFARLADGVQLAEAQSEMEAITGRLARD
jgi:putative ABC transport system permease protein